MHIDTFDTTLRDGTQGEGICFTVDEKLLIAEKLGELGIDYIEGGWPGSNPKDHQFFERARGLSLRNSRLVAFGSTHSRRFSVEDDPSVQAMVLAGTPCVAIFGKSWDLHVHRVLEISEDQNLRIISDTVLHLKKQGREVIYDAEHFFDGYAANPTFALKTIEAAKVAGADVIVLCDTNGGTLTSRIATVCAAVRKRVEGVLGIHSHNDSELAVANALAAVENGFAHVQGCMNGYGERCGNANLASVIANLEFKMGCTTIGLANVAGLTEVARFVAEVANRPVRGDQPYVGKSAFAHKAGVHVSAVMKDPKTYEHINPNSVGNCERVLVSDLSGRGNIIYKIEEHRLEGLDDQSRRDVLDRVKRMEHEGYEFEAAEGEFELLVRQALRPGIALFEPPTYQLTSGPGGSSASVTVRTLEGARSVIAEASSPLQALDSALRRCFSHLHPAIGEVRLTSCQYRVLQTTAAARVRVLIEWAGQHRNWATMGVADNVIDAGWLALVDSIRLELMRLSAENDLDDRAVFASA
jgi:2-isopropylmalate synthase